MFFTERYKVILAIAVVLFCKDQLAFAFQNDSIPRPIRILDSTACYAYDSEQPVLNFGEKIAYLLKDSSRWLHQKKINPNALKQSNEIYLIQRLPNVVYPNPALLICFHSNGFQIYIDDKPVYACGKLSNDSSYRYFNTVLIPIEKDYRNKYIILRVHYDHNRPLLDITNFIIGSGNDLSKVLTETQYRRLSGNLGQYIAAFIQTIIGIISLLIFFMRWKEREYIFLFFSTFAFSSGMMDLLKYIHPFLNLSVEAFYYLSIFIIYSVPVGFLGFIKHLAKSSKKSALNYAFWLSIVILIGSMFLPIGWPAVYFFWGSALIYISIILHALFAVKLHHNKAFMMPLLSILFLIFCIVHDGLRDFVLPDLPFDLYHWAMLLVIIAFGYYIEYQYRETYNKVMNYSLELEKTKNYLLALEKENLSTQYQVLKDQVNPHFLFNSLNTLSSLIRNNPEDAVRFVEEFADLYRYVLDVNNQFVVELKKELNFIETYIYLQKIRYGENLRVNVTIAADYLEDLVIPFSLQILIENAIKHNEISEKYPLEIAVYSENNFIVVSNRMKIIECTHSKGIGLKNLKERYTGVTDVVPEFYIDNGIYIAKIPVIKGE